MSDTLQEREDQMGEHQVNRSGACEIRGCPCRGWSAQETVKESKHPFDECQYDYGDGIRCCIYRSCHPGKEHLNHEFVEQAIGFSDDEHQPATRGGGEGELSMRDFDYHPYGDVTLNVTNNGVTVAIAYMQGRGREPKEWAEKIATAYNQHHSLVAERESYAQLLKAAKSLIAMNNCNYGRSAMRERGGFIELEKAVEAIEQRSTSE